MKPTHLRLSLASAGLCAVALALGERWARDRFAQWEARGFNPYRESQTAVFELQPGWEGVLAQPDGEFAVPLRVNSRGTRGGEFVVPKPAGTFRMIMLGDSMTFGWGVREEEAVPAVCERALARILGPGGRRIEVINAGVPGTTTDQQYRYVVERGLSWQPDLVIVNFLPQNDIRDLSWNEWEEVDAEGLPVRIVSRWYSVRPQGQLRTRFANPFDSALIGYLRLRFRRKGVLLRDDSLSPPEVAADSPFEAWARWSGPVARGTFEEHWRRAQLVLRGIHDASRRAGAVAVLHAISHLAEGPLCEFAREAGMPFTATYAAMQATGREYEEISFPHDKHWNAEGCRIAGEALARLLLPWVEPGRYRSGFEMRGCDSSVATSYRTASARILHPTLPVRVGPDPPRPGDSLTVTVDLSGGPGEAACAVASLPGPNRLYREFVLRDDGRAPDATAGDRIFTGSGLFGLAWWEKNDPMLFVEPRDSDGLGFYVEAEGVASPIAAALRLKVVRD